jgi:predicted TIM-barrel fold metal-dependent hydrolase
MEKKLKKRREIPVIKSPTRQKIILLLAAGTALGLTRSYRKQLQIIKTLPREWRHVDRAYLWRVMREFNQDKLIDWQENNDGTISVVLTEKGKQTASRFDPDNLSIPRPNHWDKKWRVIIYDIPDNKKAARDALRRKLYELSFKEWQKSVFIHPYPCDQQIDFVIEFFDVRPYVRRGLMTNITNEAEIKLHFGLR